MLRATPSRTATTGTAGDGLTSWARNTRPPTAAAGPFHDSDVNGAPITVSPPSSPAAVRVLVATAQRAPASESGRSPAGDEAVAPASPEWSCGRSNDCPCHPTRQHTSPGTAIGTRRSTAGDGATPASAATNSSTLSQQGPHELSHRGRESMGREVPIPQPGVGERSSITVRRERERAPWLGRTQGTHAVPEDAERCRSVVRKGSPVRVRQRAPKKVPETGPFSLDRFVGGGALPLPGPRLDRIPKVSACVSRIDSRYRPANRHFLRA